MSVVAFERKQDTGEWTEKELGAIMAALGAAFAQGNGREWETGMTERGDAQFYLLNCHFAKNMRDQAIYRVPTSNTIQWGERIYYYNCHREGGTDYTWYANNLPAGISAADITPKWVFGNRWTPEQEKKKQNTI